MPAARTRFSLAALFGGLLLIGCAPVGNSPPQAHVDGAASKADKSRAGEKAKPNEEPGPSGSPKGDEPPAKSEDELPARAKSDEAPPAHAKGDGSRAPAGEPPGPKAAPPAPPAGAGPRRFALLVGIAEYDSAVGDLLYSENDVVKLAEALRTGGYKDADVVVMTSTAGKRDKTLLPTSANIAAQLAKLLAAVHKDDVVLVAFAGHGVQPAADKAYFCAYQTKLDDPKTMVAIDDVIDAMNKSAATTKILLVDACRNTLARAPRVREDAVTDLPTVTGRDGTATIAYFSCDKGEKSWEVDELKHGVFFAQVIDALSGAADTYPDGQVTWGEMVDYVQRNINFHNSKFAAKKQTPHFRGEVRNAAPIVVRPAAAKVDVSKAVTTAPAAASGDAVNEDFRGVESGGLPRGWTGPAFTRTYDEKASRACIELRRKEGDHFLYIPLARPLAGNFAVEVEFRLAGVTNHNNQWQYITLNLEAEGGQIIPVAVHHNGNSLFSDTKSGDTKQYKEGAINRLKLVREGESYALFLNDGDVISTQIKYTGQINGLRVGATHRFPDPNYAPKLITRLYSVKAGSAKPGDPALAGRLVFAEDFHARTAGAVLPPGWEGAAFSVATDERFDLKALEVNKAGSQLHWVSVPKLEDALGKGRSFAIDLDVRLSGYHDTAGFNADRPQAHEVYLRLEGPGSLPLTLAMDAYGRVRLSGEKETKAKWFSENATNQLRLIQQNGVVEVLVNGVSVVTSKRPLGNYSELAIGLVGGVPQYGFAAKLYGVRLTALPGKDADVAPLRVIAEDFLRTPIGAGPKEWGGQNVACRPAHGRPGNLIGMPTIQLTDPDKSGSIAVPFKPYDVKLDGDFTAALEFYHYYDLYKSTVTFGLHGSGKGHALEVVLFYKDSKYWLQVRSGGVALPAANVTQIVDSEKPCTIVLERSGNAVAVTLNGQPVGKVPVGKTPHVYEGAQINLATTARHSPQVNRVFVAAK